MTEVKLTTFVPDLVKNSINKNKEAAKANPEMKTDIKEEPPVYDVEPIIMTPEVEEIKTEVTVIKKEREEPLEEGECTSDDD